MKNILANKFLVLPLAWGLLWILPWADWLAVWPWLCLAISIVMFVLPGMAISLMLAGDRLSILSHSLSGLAISIFLVGILGLLGRVLHLNFSFVKIGFVFSGLVALFALFWYSRSGRPLFKPKHFSALTWIFLLLVIIFGGLITLQNRFGGDDFSYLAYLTNWQHATPLNFEEVYFGSGSLDSIRFWLAMFPVSLALLAEISHLHGLLLLGLYLDPFIMVIAILAAYNLYEDLLQSEYKAIAALLLQLMFLYLLRSTGQSPGGAFFSRLSEDKAFAAFVIAPVFFIAVRTFIEAFTIRMGIFILVLGLSLALTHPVILAYCIFIACLYSGIVLSFRKELKKAWVIFALLVAVILPSGSLRFVEASAGGTKAPFNLEDALDTTNIDARISYIESTPFYGFDIDILKIPTMDEDQSNPLQTFFSWSYLWIMVLGFLWSLVNLKKNTYAPFIAATSLLVILCAIPYTGWLVGYFVSARMLWRAPWLLPIGLIGVVLLAEFVKFVFHKASITGSRKPPADGIVLGLMSVVCFTLVGYFSTAVYRAGWQELAGYKTYRNNLEKLASLGDYLEKNIEQPAVFDTTSELRNYLPGLSSKSKPVYFRNSRITPSSVNLADLGKVYSLDPQISVSERIYIFEKYHIQYIIHRNSSLQDYYASDPQYFRVLKAGDFWIINFLDAGSN